MAGGWDWQYQGHTDASEFRDAGNGVWMSRDHVVITIRKQVPAWNVRIMKSEKGNAAGGLSYAIGAYKHTYILGTGKRFLCTADSTEVADSKLELAIRTQVWEYWGKEETASFS
jgi:hypothetical protein